MIIHFNPDLVLMLFSHLSCLQDVEKFFGCANWYVKIFGIYNPYYKIPKLLPYFILMHLPILELLHLLYQNLVPFSALNLLQSFCLHLKEAFQSYFSLFLPVYLTKCRYLNTATYFNVQLRNSVYRLSHRYFWPIEVTMVIVWTKINYTTHCFHCFLIYECSLCKHYSKSSYQDYFSTPGSKI